jgi:hypothetical protein
MSYMLRMLETEYLQFSHAKDTNFLQYIQMFFQV